MAYDREKVRRELIEAQRQALEEPDVQRYASMFIGDIQTWQCEAGTHKVDILPWEGGKNINMFNPKWLPGATRYVLPYFVHYEVGVSGEHVMCLKMSVGLPCPVCEQRRVVENSGEGNVEDYYWKKRTLYNILVADNPEKPVGPFVWDVAEFFIESHIKAFMEAAKDSGEVFIAFDPEEGQTLQFTRKGQGKGKTKFIAHQLLERDYVIPVKTLEKVYKLDEIIRIPSYEEVYKKLHGVEPSTGKRSTVQSRSEDDDVPSRLGEDASGGEPVIQKKGRTQTVAAKPEPPEDEGVMACPYGGTFGVSFNTLKKCDVCVNFDPCQQASEEVAQPVATQKKGKPAPPAAEPEEETTVVRKRTKIK